jgi:hypothetical protein
VRCRVGRLVGRLIGHGNRHGTRRVFLHYPYA